MSGHYRHLFALPVLAVALAACQGDTQPDTMAHSVTAASVRQEDTSSATITAIDPATREITLQTEDGRQNRIVAGDDVRNFDELRVGDVVRASYESAVVAVLAGSDAELSTDAEARVITAPEGAMPAGLGGTAIHEVVQFVSYDAKAHNVTIRRVDGSVSTFTLTDASMQNFAASLVEGDKVEIGYTEAIAVTVEPQS
ncbi:MAG: hypothetical protein H6851_19130 [Geminicoccaceae bacterium]|nr:hypothetical protein [Geminicoccaceae bacterium]MCB9945724.1 hypothetical protein [Geminicoccaceae bacterium]